VHSHRISPPMRAWILVSLAAAAFTSAVISSPVVAAPLSVPFDFSRGAIGLDVTIGGQPVYLMLDTGVDPSVIDIDRAEALGLKIDRGVSGEASGFGDAKSASVFAATISGLAIGSRDFGPVDALASRYEHGVGGIWPHARCSARIQLPERQESVD